MGIFSFLNQTKSQNQDLVRSDDAQTISQAEEKPKPELPNLYREMPVEILGENGQVMINGLITMRNGQEITLGRRPGGLSFKLCEPESSVVIRVCDNRMEQFCLQAVVAESSRVGIRLKDLTPKIQDDLRSTFRLTVNTPISIFYYDDEHMRLPEEGTLEDISTGGCRISSKQLYKEGEVLRLKIKLEDYVPMNFVGEVIRVTERGDKDYSYGILFAQMKKEEQDNLTRTLFNLQVGNRKEHSRVSGHW